MTSTDEKVKVRELVENEHAWVSKIHKVGKNKGFIVKDGPKHLGFVLYKVKGEVCHVSWIEVIEERRKEQLGTLLINRLKELLPELITVSFDDTNLTMALFLKACSFLCIGDTDGQYTFEWRQTE